MIEQDDLMKRIHPANDQENHQTLPIVALPKAIHHEEIFQSPMIIQV